jgi:peptide/nickel transport system permease protein
VRRRLRPSVWVSLGILAVLGVFAVFETVIAPYDPLDIGFTPLQAPSLAHPFGTDQLGRDVFSRFVGGTRISFIVGLVCSMAAAALGIAIGLVAAYFERMRAPMMRLMDAIWAFPTILLAMALAVSLPPGIVTVMVAVVVVYVPLFARLVYAQAIALLERDFILAARAFGCRPLRLLVTHMLPNLAAPVIVQATLTVGSAIVFESSLSFLGIGIQPPTPSWGVMIQSGYKWLESAAWISVLPGLGIYFTVISFSVLGDWLRIALDPRQRSGKA